VRGSSRFGIKPSNVRIYADPSRAAGLTRYQVGVLKRLARKRKLKDPIRLKRGMPFAPALGAGLFIGVLYGDLYLTILTKLMGF
jgi:preflagellin peptidase FlaK